MKRIGCKIGPEGRRRWRRWSYTCLVTDIGALVMLGFLLWHVPFWPCVLGGVGAALLFWKYGLAFVPAVLGFMLPFAGNAPRVLYVIAFAFFIAWGVVRPAHFICGLVAGFAWQLKCWRTRNRKRSR